MYQRVSLLGFVTGSHSSLLCKEIQSPPPPQPLLDFNALLSNGMPSGNGMSGGDTTNANGAIMGMMALMLQNQQQQNQQFQQVLLNQQAAFMQMLAQQSPAKVSLPPVFSCTSNPSNPSNPLFF